MSYQVLSQKDTQSPTTEDSENEQSHSSQRRISVSILTLLVLSSTTLISVLLLLLLFTTSRASRQCPVQDNGWSVSRPYLGENTSQMGLDHEHDHMWSDLEPITGFGLIYKENPDTAGMISMFHQTQCLAVFRQALQAQEDGRDVGHGEKEIQHARIARHCLDYMYQTLRCFADDTIEWEIPTTPRTKLITGMDTVRTCRDSSKLVKQACDAREVYIRNGWKDPPLPSMCTTGEMPW